MSLSRADGLYVTYELDGYTGTINDKVHKYLADVHGYDESLAINDMMSLRLSSLGYDGSINDQTLKFGQSFGFTDLSDPSLLVLDDFILDEENGYVLLTEDGLVLRTETP